MTHRHRGRLGQKSRSDATCDKVRISREIADFQRLRSTQEARRESESAATALAAIQRIYRIERRCRDERARGPDLVAMRQGEVVPILDELETFFKDLQPKALPQSLLGKAVGCAIGQWPAIRRYASVAEADADNNSCEQTMRVPVLGRKTGCLPAAWTADAAAL